MEEIELQKLEEQIDELINTIATLQSENKSLKSDKSSFDAERNDWAKKIDLAKESVEKMVNRLKTMEDSW